MDGDNLLEAIRRSPEDTLLRLAYADWLEERDHWPQAEFIRAHLEWDNARNLKVSSNGYFLAHRRYLAASKAWRTFLPPGMPATVWQNNSPRHGTGLLGVRFRRGLVEAVSIHRTEVWLEWGARLLERHPVMAADLAFARPGDLRTGAVVLSRAPCDVGARWFWLCEQDSPFPFSLNLELFGRLRGGELVLETTMDTHGARLYETPDLARQDLSDALLAMVGGALAPEGFHDGQVEG